MYDYPVKGLVIINRFLANGAFRVDHVAVVGPSMLGELKPKGPKGRGLLIFISWPLSFD